MLNEVIQQLIESSKLLKGNESTSPQDYKSVTFTKEELLSVFKHFINRLVKDHGNDRDEMIKYHINKLVGLPYSKVIQKMPRGPSGHWEDLMFDIRDELKEKAKKKAKQLLKEGTWSCPYTVAAAKHLQKLMQSPIKAKTAGAQLYNVMGDDDLFDQIDDVSAKHPDADVRPMVKSKLEKWIESADKGTWKLKWDPKALEILRKIV